MLRQIVSTTKITFCFAHPSLVNSIYDLYEMWLSTFKVIQFKSAIKERKLKRVKKMIGKTPCFVDNVFSVNIRDRILLLNSNLIYYNKLNYIII